MSHKTLVGLTVLLLLLVGVDYLNAWTPPTGTPPTGNVSSAINTGTGMQNKNGALGVNALGVFGGGVVISGIVPRIEYADTSAGISDWYHQANENFFYLLNDRNDDDAYTGENPWPMQTFAGPTAATDYTTFSNQVRATQFCDRAGNNCYAPGTASTQLFSLAGASGQASNSLDLGAWTMCALSGQSTSADDNNMYDSCRVEKVSASNWRLLLSKASEDWLRCEAVCLSI